MSAGVERERKNDETLFVPLVSGPYHEVPFAVVHIAAPLLAMGNAQGAVGLLSAAFQSAKTSARPATATASSLAPAIGAMLAVALAESGDVSASCGAAQEAATVAGIDGDAPCASFAWMTLADVYARIGMDLFARFVRSLVGASRGRFIIHA